MLAPNDGTPLMGQLANGESGQFILSYSGISAYGMLEAGLHRFLFRSYEGGQFGSLHVGEVDHWAFPGCGVSDEPPVAVAPAPAENSSSPKVQPSPTYEVEGQVLYSNAVESNQGGDPAAFINTLSASINGAMNGGSVTGSYKVVRYKLVLTWRRALARCSCGSDPAACGIANIPSLNGQDALAFSVVSDGCGAGDLTFAHEVSHTLGGRHDWQDDNNADTDFGGTNHGYSNEAVTFRTVMGQRPNGTGSACTFLGGCPD